MSTDRDHDAVCPWRRFTVMARADCQFCPVLARARADERSRLYGGQGWIAQDDVATWLTDLHAKVEGLPVQVVNMQAVPGQPDDFREAVLLVDVLALFPEEVSE